MLVAYLFITLFGLLSPASASDTSLSFCQAVTTYFFNTCADTDGDGFVDAADSVATMTGETVIAKVNECPESGEWISDDVCQWTRKLCVSCDDSSGTTRIRVQMNNLPDSSGVNAPLGQGTIDEKNIDFEVNFNSAVVRGSNFEIEATTQDEVDDALCSDRAMASTKIPDGSDYVAADGSDEHFANAFVTLTGIVSWGTSSKDADPWYPPLEWNGESLEVESVDNCLVHAAGGWLHHHSFSPSVWASDGSTCVAYKPLSQFDDDVSITTLMFEGEDGNSMDGREDLEIVGIALDGHLVFGPYASTSFDVYEGTGLDLCNGVRYDDDADGARDAYAYFVSKTFPYQPGCWGPANYPDHTPDCTTNAQSSYSTKPALFSALEGSSSSIGPKPTSQPTPTPSFEPTSGTALPTGATGDPNVLIVQMDDALAAYFEDWGDDVNPPDFPDGYRYEDGDFDGLSESLPNIDSVRKNGISFTRAYTTSSACAPTRFSVLTGRYPSRGVFNTLKSANSYGSDSRTYVQVSWAKLDDFDSSYNAATIFSGQGYATAHIGKWHLTPTTEAGGSMEYDNYTTQVSAVEARGFDYVDGLYAENINVCVGEDYCSTFTHNLDWMTTRAVEFMDENSDVPFFLYFNPTMPHEPDLDELLVDSLCADGESTCDRQDTVAGRLDAVPTVYNTLCFSEDCEMPSYADLWDTVEAVATKTRLESAVASAVWIDDSLGVMLTYLEEQGKLENTIILVTSDNGSSKRTLYETGVRTPLFVRWTRGGILKGGIISELVSSIDLLPTLVDLVFPAYSGYTNFDGISWADLATGAATSLSRDSIIVEYGFDRAVIRSDNYKLINTLDNSTCYETEGNYPACTAGNQLYYLTSDDAEQTSLAFDSSYSTILSELGDLIDDHDDETIDSAPVSPTFLPTFSPTTCFEPDADSWTSPSGYGCSWVAANPDVRCSIGGSTPASDYCLNACGTCPDGAPTPKPTAAPTGCPEPNAGSWTSPSGNGCDWVAANPTSRCSVGGSTPASDYCLNACGTCPDDDSATTLPTVAPTSCPEPNADSWTSPAGNGCDWVAANPTSRCSVGGSTPASDYCLNACGTCPDDDGATTLPTAAPTSCPEPNADSWTSPAGNGCDWVAANPTSRCSVGGSTPASDYCLIACGTCPVDGNDDETDDGTDDGTCALAGESCAIISCCDGLECRSSSSVCRRESSSSSSSSAGVHPAIVAATMLVFVVILVSVFYVRHKKAAKTKALKVRDESFLNLSAEGDAVDKNVAKET